VKDRGRERHCYNGECSTGFRRWKMSAELRYTVMQGDNEKRKC